MLKLAAQKKNKGKIMNEISYSPKEAVKKLNTALEDLAAAKETNISKEQKERLNVLEEVLPRAIAAAKKSRKGIKLHEFVNNYR